jgi:cytochrome c-type biogenesis protein CcmF
VFEGVNQDNGHPILRAHLNALVMWIWMGVWVMLIGTVLALVPNAPAPVRVPAPARLGQSTPAPVATGD